jgi:alpha-tubulin suppressor-like RCC1 family protein
MRFVFGAVSRSFGAAGRSGGRPDEGATTPRVRSRAVVIAVAAALALAGLPLQLDSLLGGTARALVVDGTGFSACVVVAGGGVKCWGDNSHGQLGDGTTDNSMSPVSVSGISTATAVSTGGFQTCALLASGGIDCWGGNSSGELGNGSVADSPTPVPVTGISGAVEVTAGRSHTCAIVAGGVVKCWGDNSAGQLGDGTTTARHTPVTVTGITGAVDVAAGAWFTCAVLSSGSTRCWGSNSNGQLGNGTTTDSHTAVVVKGITTAKRVGTGEAHACAVLADGSVRCWGWNYENQLGTGWQDSSIPVVVPDVSNAMSISAGYYHTCVVGWNAAVTCWGLDDPSRNSWGSVATVAGLPPAVAVQVHIWSTCAVLADSSVRCWGDNSAGQLGIGVPPFHGTPVAVTGLTAVSGLTVGEGDSCAVASGGVACWGWNQTGAAGVPIYTDQPLPNAITGITDAAAVAVAGEDHACAIVAAGAVECWGNGTNGQLGNGGTDPSDTPVPVTGLTGATSIAAAYDISCVVVPGGVIKCWGGVGPTGQSNTPVTIMTIPNATAISLGNSYYCALLSTGSVKCWGFNSDGELGNGTTKDSATPVTVSGITTATAITTGDQHACALLSGGAVKCWGANSFGELGNGSESGSLTPVTVSGLGAASAVSAGGSDWGDASTCAALVAGGVACWGNNGTGQLGNGSTDWASSTPVGVTGITTATAVAVGGDHVCALLASGAVDCWGTIYNGQLGNGQLGYSLTPIEVPGVTAPDNYPPLVTEFTPSTTATQATSVSYTLSFSEPVTGLSAASLVQAGTATGCVIGAPSGSWTSYAVDVTGCSTGTVILTVAQGAVTDAAANAGPAKAIAADTVWIDQTPPTTGGPTLAVRKVALSGTSVPVTVSWAGSDATGSGIAHYELAKSTDGGATWTPISTSLTAAAYSMAAAPSGTIRFEVRAVDKAGNIGSWTVGPVYTPRLAQTSSGVTYAGTWSSQTSASYSGGSTRYSSKAGSSATYKFTGRSVSIVMTRSKTRGSVRIYVDGSSSYSTVSCAATTTAYRSIVWSKAWASSGTHKIKVVVVGTSGRPRIDFDAIVVIK